MSENAADRFDDDAFLALDAEFDASHARHHVITQDEARDLAEIIDVEATPRLRFDASCLRSLSASNAAACWRRSALSIPSPATNRHLQLAPSRRA